MIGVKEIRLSALSLEYVLAQVRIKVGGVVIDPTDYEVEMAFPAPRVDPVVLDWAAADWETVGSRYFARCLVGPGGTITKAKGRYDVWAKVTANPEIPARRVGRLVVT